MENYKAIQLLNYLKNLNYCDDETSVAINEGIRALEFESRARELLDACIALLSKQKESDYTLNMLEETVYYDEAENDGSCLIDDILSFLIDG